MTRETELHFSNVPAIDISRCKLAKAHDHKTTFNTGDIIPIFVDDIIPGTTVKMRESELVRMMTPIAPVMDNAYLDIMFFFVPNRLLWDHWINFMGENDTAPWTQQQNYTVPKITCPAGGWAEGSLADYMGLPTKVYGSGWKANALPFRAYVKIYNDWFRDENNQNPIYMSTGDSDTTGKNVDANYDKVTYTECGAKPLKACKIHDYFTSALPGPQKGPSVNIPLGQTAPVVGGPALTEAVTDTGKLGWQAYANASTFSFYDTENPSSTGMPAVGKNLTLITDLSQAIGATVNQLRQAFAVQKFYERAARGGSRYIESIKSHFRTTNPDFRMQRAEYLGGRRIPININSVVQTDASGKSSYWDEDNSTWVTDDKTPQGNLAAYSATADSNPDMWTHSFTEHGVLMGVAICRTQHTYQQGLNRMWSRDGMFSYYWPELANIGETGILNKEIYLQGTSTDDEAFGYQEAWAEYRYMPDRVSGLLRSNASQSLDIWHYGDDYNALPVLSSDWIEEPEENMARTLAVQSEHQFFGDFYFSPIYTLPMPLYSVPGLIDHH